MSLFVVFGIGYYLSKSYEVEAVSVVSSPSSRSYYLLRSSSRSKTSRIRWVNVIPLDRLGAKGMFLAMITGFLAGEIYRFIVQKELDDQDAGWCTDRGRQIVLGTRTALLTLTVFLGINIAVTSLLDTNLHDLIFNLVQKPLVNLGNGLVPTLIAIFFVQLFWFFGLHGQVIVNSVMDPILEHTVPREPETPIPRTGKSRTSSASSSSKSTPSDRRAPGSTLAVVVAILLFSCAPSN